MNDVLDVLRRSVASRPLWLFFAFLLVSMVIRRLLRRGRPTDAPNPAMVRVATILGLAYYVVPVGWYALVPQQSDYAEPTMTSVAWLFRIGKPLYHAFDSAERYLSYGTVPWPSSFRGPRWQPSVPACSSPRWSAPWRRSWRSD